MKPGTRKFLLAAVVIMLVASACGGTAAPRPVRPVVGPGGWLWDTTTFTVEVSEQPAVAAPAESAPAADNNSTVTTSWMPDSSHPLGSADPNGCPANPEEANALFGGNADRWNQLDDPTKVGNEKWPGWSMAEARHSDTTPTFPYLYVPANMRADWWDNDISHSTMGPGYIGPVSEATFWCWVKPGQTAPHPLWKALNSPPQ